MRTCADCGIELPLEKFRIYGKPRVNGSRYRRRICPECENAENREHRRNNLEQVREYFRGVYSKNKVKESARSKVRSEKERFRKALRTSRLKAAERGYIPCSSTAGELEKLFTGYCAICGVPEVECTTRLCLDHDHGPSGAARGFLCHKCNRAIGLLSDNPELLLRAAEYLKTGVPTLAP